MDNHLLLPLIVGYSEFQLTALHMLQTCMYYVDEYLLKTDVVAPEELWQVAD